MKMCEAFTKNGHSATLLSPAKNSDLNEDPFKYYGVEKSFKIYGLPGKFLPHGSEVRLHLYGIYCCLKALWIRPDIIYGRNAHGLFYCSLLGFNFIYELHYAITPSSKPTYLLKSKRLNHLVVVSDALKSKVADLVFKKIIVAHNAANLPDQKGVDDPEVVEKLQSDSKIKIGYVGHLYPGKGGELIIDLAKELPNVAFHIVGGFDKDMDRLKKQAPVNVVFHGFYSPAEIPYILSGFDILMLTPLPHVLAYENDKNIGETMSPLKLFEYMAAGKAILATDLPVLREVLKHNENAILVPPDKIDNWKNELLRLIHDNELRNHLGANAKLDQQNLYTWQKRAAIVLNPND